MHERGAVERAEDEGIAADFTAGKREGLERVYRACGRPLYSVARAVLGDDDDAQDCVHDVLLRVWQNASTYRPERGTLRSYLLVCVRNEALTRKRNAARRLRIEERVARDERSDDEIDVTDAVQQQRLRAALAALPPEQRAALDLAYFGELTHVQVADRLGVPLGTAKSRIALALRKLNVALTKTGTSAP